MFEKLEIFATAAAMARHAGQRQAVISQNVANADTPDYVARDLPAFDVLYGDSTGHNRLQRASRPSHLHGRIPGAPAPIIDMPADGAPNGNQVSLETEMLHAVDAMRQHDRAISIYKSALSVLRTTLRK